MILNFEKNLKIGKIGSLKKNLEIWKKLGNSGKIWKFGKNVKILKNLGNFGNLGKIWKFGKYL